MVGQVADIFIMFEGDGERQCVKGCFPSATNWAKVVSGEERRNSQLCYSVQIHLL